MGIGKKKTDNLDLFDYSVNYQGKDYKGTISLNEVNLLPIPYDKVKIKLNPNINVDIGNGFGEEVIADIFGGEVASLTKYPMRKNCRWKSMFYI